MRAWTISGRSLTLRQGDLTRARTEAVVNAANPGLAGGGGVDGAIHRAAGPMLLEACLAIVRSRGRLAPGRAVLTQGFGLAARYVIHTVGPIWRGGGRQEEATLRAAYVNSLALAAENEISSLAFPAISCGAYGYPLDLAAAVALRALCAGLESGLAQGAEMYLRGDAAFEIWTDAARNILGRPERA
ncbi:MAG: macro domain-containing protein [Desulfovibrionaceae bacterium]|nr:macro domain-containing protein [Desulfovibrionaceae bacterium]